MLNGEKVEEDRKYGKGENYIDINGGIGDININFEKGKIHGLIGRNGSGKTVLMKCICAKQHPI